MAKKAIGVKLVLKARLGATARRAKAWSSNFRVEFDDGTSKGVASNQHRLSAIFQRHLNVALRDAMRQFADNIEDGIWQPKE